MSHKTPGILLLACLSPLLAQETSGDRFKAQHDIEDRKWAEKTGLPVNEIRAIRIAAGISDDAPGLRIANLDAKSLKQRNHILLVEGPCVKLHVIERGAGGLTEVWSLNELPRPAWKIAQASRPGRGICSQSPRAPSAHATADGQIVLEVPFLLDPFQRTLPVDTYTFRWDGNTYIVVDGER
jgi:hypothetical protein